MLFFACLQIDVEEMPHGHVACLHFIFENGTKYPTLTVEVVEF